MQKTTLILGASGCVGTALRAVWPTHRPALWQSRRPPVRPDDIHWDVLQTPPPDLPPLRGVVVLAGTAQAGDLDVNLRIARAVVGLNAPVLLASTQAVYGTPRDAVSETCTPNPQSDYGRAKLQMEQAVHGHPNVCCLRLANVVGCDTLGRIIAGLGAGDSLALDQFQDGQGPQRMVIRPAVLAMVLGRLLDQPDRLPKVLNVAEPNMVRVQDVLTDQGTPWHWRQAPEGALAKLEMDVTALRDLVPELTGWDFKT